MKLGTLIKHDEMMCHAKELYLLLAYLWNFPLIIFHSISCLLYNSKTIRDFSIKHGTRIKHDAQESLLLLSYLWSYFPLIIFQTISCPLYNLKTVRDISMKLGTLIKQILTHLAYIANGKKRVILCNNFTGRISVTLLCGICDVSYPTKQR